MISGAARVAPEKAVFRPALPMSYQPGISEMHMATLTYKEQYLHPNWQRKRLEVMEDAGFECENCGDSDATLNVHHKRYVKGRMVWQYERNELACLCETCHENEHAGRQALDLLLMQSTGLLATVVPLIAGYMEGALLFGGDVDAQQFVGDRRMEYEIGLLASMLDGLMPDACLKAVEGAREIERLTPAQAAAIARWRDFADKLDKSDL